MSVASDVAFFLKHALPWGTGTYVNIEAFEWVPDPSGIPGKGTLGKRKASRAARDHAEAVGFALWCDSMGWEVYVRMASAKNPGIAKPRKGGGYNHRALGGRANAAELVSSYVDVDVKAGAHATGQEARQAFTDMCRAVGLPDPTIIVWSGGGGFHAHFIHDRPIAVADWDQLAPCLAEACRQHAVLADHNITVNAVCLLRIPGTTNRKYGQPRPVVLDPQKNPRVSRETLIQGLAPYALPKNSSSATPGAQLNDSWDLTNFPAQPPVDFSAWVDGIENGMEPYALEDLIRGGCGWVKETLETGGLGQREPQWKMVANLCSFTAGGLTDFVRLSDKDPRYTLDATETLFERVAKTQRETDYGWPRCRTIQLNGATACANCPHLGKDKSPLNFAVRLTRPSNPQDPGENGGNSGSNNNIPLTTITVAGYADDPATGIYSITKLTKKGDPIDVEVTSFPVWNLDSIDDDQGRPVIHFDSARSKLGLCHIQLPTSELASTDALRRCLVGKYGLPLYTEQNTEVLNFMAAFKEQMRLTRDTIPRQELMGWCDANGKTVAFIYGNTKYNGVGNTPYHQSDQTIRENYSPTGSIDPWLEAMKMLNGEKRPEMDVLAATAFAAPLMKFSGEKGVVVSAYSTASGVHKTSAIRLGQATWGAQKAAAQLIDTENRILELVGKTRVMPTYVDEMKSSQARRDFIRTVYTVAGGRGKGRLNRNAEMKDVATWDTLLVGVSNESLAGFVANNDFGTDAGVMRIFEFEILPLPPNAPGQISLAHAGAILKKLENNYGRAGERYAEYLGKNAPLLGDKVTEKVAALVKLFNAEGPERFWVSAAAVILLGAQYANDINLSRFDVPAMEHFLGRTFQNLRAQRISNTGDLSDKEAVKSLLAVYLAGHRRSILETDTIGQAANVRGAVQASPLNMGEIMHTTEFTARWIQDANELRLSKPAITKWLTDNKKPYTVFFNTLKREFGATEHIANLLSGTKWGGTKGRCIHLDLNHPDLLGFYER